MAKFSQRSKDALKGVHPDLVRVMEAAIADTPQDFTIVEGVRTAARQAELYAQGRTIKGRAVKGPIVTNADGVTKKSNHQPKADGYGHAVDLYPYYDGKVQVQDKDVIRRLGVIARHVKDKAARLGVAITWGGDWRSPHDPPHFELKQ